MKISKFILAFSILFTIGIITSYANIENNNWTHEFIETFEQTNSKFKLYNIKINSIIFKNKYKENVNQICEETIHCFKIDKDNLIYDIDKKKDKINIFIKTKDNSCSIHLKLAEKNNEEYYINIDILSNKVYKNIGDMYRILNKIFNKNYKDTQIDICIIGEYTKNLQLHKSNDILQNILYNMNAKQIDKIIDKNFISVTAYSDMLSKNNLEYFDKKINLNIGIRYSKNKDKTLVYIATPIIKIDY